MLEQRNAPELLWVDDEPDSHDAPFGHFDAHDALGTAVPEVADEARPSVDPPLPYGEVGRGVAKCSGEESGDFVGAVDGSKRGARLPSTVGVEGHVVREHREQGLHVTVEA